MERVISAIRGFLLLPIGWFLFQVGEILLLVALLRPASSWLHPSLPGSVVIDVVVILAVLVPVNLAVRRWLDRDPQSPWSEAGSER